MSWFWEAVAPEISLWSMYYGLCSCAVTALPTVAIVDIVTSRAMSHQALGSPGLTVRRSGGCHVALMLALTSNQADESSKRALVLVHKIE